MRLISTPWIWLSVIVLALADGTARCESATAAKAEAIETLTRDISLPPRAGAESLESFTGAIRLGRNSRVDGDVETGAGELVLEPGADVGGDLSSDSGSIRIDGARVGGLVSTTSGDIYIGPDSRIEGGIRVDKRNVIGLTVGDFRLGLPIGRSTPPRIVIGPRATVLAVLRFKREVKLFVSESATIGAVIGAKPVMYSTELPPQ
ncbi:MAG TPA: polymer-forming cytoskeletal protein [Steroidobacteraceae bacterium]|nr:polymer-forming cytoskeletal protein [Steroidobacteraceae bacterium]